MNSQNRFQCNRNNSNNTKVTEDPFLVNTEKTSGQKVLSEDGTTKDPSKKSIQTQTTYKENISVIQHEWKLEVSSKKNGNIIKSHANLNTITTSISKVQTKSSVFQKWADMDKGSQRPLAKRQLSAESSTCKLRMVKKIPVKKGRDEEEGSVAVKPGSKLIASPGETYAAVEGSVANRKLKKELYANEDAFADIDAHVINAGKELRSKRVFSVQAITQTITERAQSDLEKIRAIWIWLCHFIEYDVSGYLGLTDKLCSPEEVIKSGKAVCCGYSSVYLQMCREVGIECREVSGHGKGIGYSQGQSYQNSKSSHMWNAVRLGGHWYPLDACWGSGRVDLDNKTFIKRYDDFYFLTDPEEFINSHCPDEPEWQLLDSPVPLEEFERRVLRTSEFYRLGLTLLHPKHFLLVTDNGEASVSMKFSDSVDFTYHISKINSNQPIAVSCSSGLLTIARDTMMLRLLPPASGAYDVMIFARPGNTSGAFRWVCSFQLECPEPKPSDELPENPFLSWGPQRNAEFLGVKRCSHGPEPVLLENGSLELDFQTSRPLMMICELSHKDLEPSTAKRCLATQIQPDHLTCHVLCPYLGYYRFSVFVRDFENPQDGYQNVGNFLLHCTGSPVNLNDLFPSSLSSSCGPGTRTQDAGLCKFSHPGAIVSTQLGKYNITFQNQQDLEIHAVLSKDQRKTPGYPLSRHIFFTYNGNKVAISVVLPEAGVYKLRLYAKFPNHQDFSPMCDFVLKTTSQASLPPFPCAYTAWHKGFVLFEPRTGLLEPMSWVRFRVRVPGAQRVSILGEQLIDLRLNQSRVWEGEVFIGANVKQLKLATSGGESSTDMSIVMCFDVLSQQNDT
ncbi:lim and transglutaminase domain protein ltd-1-like [Polymixia lowei]